MTRAWCLLAAALISLARSPDHGVGRKEPASDWGVSFTDVSARAGLTRPATYGGLNSKRFIIETNGAGVAFLDYDNDNRLDALVLSGTRLGEGTRKDAAFAPGDEPLTRLYRNLGNGRFADVSREAGLTKVGWASGVCAGDYDNDGLVDLFITYYGQNTLLHNTGGHFEDVTERAGLKTDGVRWGSGCTFVDYDRDGKLDLFVANYLRFDVGSAPEPGAGSNCQWKGIPVNCGPRGLPTDTNLLFHNNGNGTFSDVSAASEIGRVTGRYSMTAVAADFDEDGWPDIYVASDSTAAILYRNNHDGTFTDVAVESGAAYNEYGDAQAGMGVAIGDYNDDGLLDIFKTHFADDIPALYRGLGRMLFRDVATQAGLAVQNKYVEWGAGMPDLDNDGYPDVMYVTGNVYPEVERLLPQYPHRGPRIVFRNRDGVRFEDVTTRTGAGVTEPHSSRGTAFGDFDGDGDLDVLVMNMNEPPSLLRNDYAGPNGWIEISLEGTRSNRSAIGATVLVTVGGRTQAQAVLSQSSYYSHDDFRLHFGTGTAPVIDAIEVRWPNGGRDRLTGVRTRQVLRIKETDGQKDKSDLSFRF